MSKNWDKIKPMINKEFLSGLYTQQKLSGTEIAKLIGIDKQMVYYWLKKFNIPRSKGYNGRFHSENVIQRLSLVNQGKHFSSATEFRRGEHVSPKTEFKIGNHPKSEFKKGHRESEETRKKRIEALKGNHNGSFKKGHSPHNKGIPCPETTREKIRETLKGKFAGIKSPTWKGGLTPEIKKIRNSIEFRLWKESVFARDNWTCQKCGERGGRLNAHHILGFAQYPELRFAIDNGITLCKECHGKFHKEYGKQNNTKEQLSDFFDNGSFAS